MDEAMIPKPDDSPDVEMDDGPSYDALEALIEALPEDYHPQASRLRSASAECKSLAGEVRMLKQLPAMKSLMEAIQFGVTGYIREHSNLPDEAAAWNEFSKVRVFQNWAGLGTTIQILESPGRTIASLLKKVDQQAQEYTSRIALTFTQKQIAPDPEFKGYGSGYLHRHICALQQGFSYGKHYARVLPIIQSSGTGKSRTAYQLAQKELGFFTCVRARHNPIVLSDYSVPRPERDDLVAEWLIPLGRGDHAKETEALCITIWLKCFADGLVRYHDDRWVELFSEYIKRPVDISHEDGKSRWARFKSVLFHDFSPWSAMKTVKRGGDLYCGRSMKSVGKS